MSGSDKIYISFLLRMWRAAGDGADAWRAAVESAQTGERAAFASLEELFVFLRDKAEAQPQDDSD